MDSDLNVFVASMAVMWVVNGVRWIAVGILYVAGLNFFFESLPTMRLPNTLLNGLFGVHPMCMLLVYVLCMLLVQYYMSMLNVSITNFVYCSTRVWFILRHYVAFFVVLAIFLGGWWANQELGWGGWWSWDNVEMITWLLFWVVVYELHVNSVVLWVQIRIMWGVIFIIGLLHGVVRWDLADSVHSFLQSRDVTCVYWAIDWAAAAGLYNLFLQNHKTRYSYVFGMWFQGFTLINFFLLICLVERLTVLNFQILWVLWFVWLLGVVISNEVCRDWGVAWGLLLFDVLLCGVRVGWDLRYLIFIFHGMIMCIFIAGAYEFSFDFFCIDHRFVDTVVNCGDFAYNIGAGWGFDKFISVVVSEVADSLFFEFHDFGGLFNFTTKESIWGGVKIIEGVVNLWGWGMDFWFYVLCVTCYVLWCVMNFRGAKYIIYN